MEPETYTENQAINIMLNSFSIGIVVGAALCGISYKIGEKFAERVIKRDQDRKINKLRQSLIGSK